MDRNVFQTDFPLYLETANIVEGNKTVTTASLPLTSLEHFSGLTTVWSPETVFRVSALLLLMLLTLLGNLIVVVTIVSCAELRKKRVNAFILSLAAGDLMVCFVSMPSYILMTTFSPWGLGVFTCKLSAYGFVVAVAFATLLLTAMSIERYQVRFMMCIYGI